ncbi:hypothetical protein ACWKTS_34650 [Bacillus toyonensis]|nr:hypothetical protein [Bacillus toyonensis]
MIGEQTVPWLLFKSVVLSYEKSVCLVFDDSGAKIVGYEKKAKDS